MHEVIMPKLGLTMETGTIEKWHKKEGDKVETGDILFEVMTDKVSLEVEAYHSGYLRKILRTAGEEVPVTEVIAFIGEKDEKIPELSKTKPAAEAVSSADTAETKTPPEVTGKIETTSIDESCIKISPLARSLAKEMGIDYLKQPIKGTGPDRRIVKEDILAFAEAQKIKESAAKVIQAEPKPAAAAEATAAPLQGGEIKIKSSTPLKGMRKVIADKMSYSKATIPHTTETVVSNVDNLISFKDRLKNSIYLIYKVKLTYSDFLIKICAHALREHLEINSSFQNGEYIIYDDINIGLAVAMDDGLIVPTMYNCDKLGILDIARKRIELIDKVKQEKLGLNEIKNGTFTISNLGMFGIRSFTAIINPPQSAILSIGEIYQSLVMVGGNIASKSFMNISLTVDHRIIDGAIGARFLQRFVELIENPELMII